MSKILTEAHVSPMAIGAPFHSGMIARVVCADLHVRWQFLTQQKNNNTLVHDSWNTFAPESAKEAFFQKDTLIDEKLRRKSRLALLPSGDLEMKTGKIDSLSHQEFRDDDPLIPLIVDAALHYLKEQGIVINGIVDGEKGLFLDLDRIHETNPLEETIKSTQIFPRRYKEDFLGRLDNNNESNYSGKIPLTRRRTFGIPVDERLFDGDSLYYDGRFSPAKQTKNTPQGNYNVCVAPLIVLALLPYIRSQYDSEVRTIGFISNGVASSVRFNLVSILLNSALGIEQPYENIHLFNKLKFDQSFVETFETDPNWGKKMRYIVYDQLSADYKEVSDDIAKMDQNTGMLDVPGYAMFRKKSYLLQKNLPQDSVDSFDKLHERDKAYLTEIGITDAMYELNFVKAFRKLRGELYKRLNLIRQGVSQNDYTLLKVLNVFFPSTV